MSCIFSTKELSSLTNKRASAGNDFKSVDSEFITIANGSTTGIINIIIYNDTIPELDETFQVIITKLEVKNKVVALKNHPRIGKKNLVNFTIQHNDYPNGMFKLLLDVSYVSSSGQNYTMLEPDSLSFALTFHVDRERGKKCNYLVMLD